MTNTSETNNAFINSIKGGRILYIATKNRDYIRVEQEISLLHKYAEEYDIIASINEKYIIRLIFVYWKIITYNKRFDKVFVGFSPQLIVPIFLWRFKNKTIIIDFFISLYDTFVFDRRKFKKNSLIAIILKWIDNVTLRRSNLIICDTREHAKYLISNLGAEPDKIVVLYLSADKKYYFPRRIDRPKALENKFIVLYFGSALPLQGINIILQAMTKISQNEIHFILIGPLERKQKPINLSNITLINWLSQEELANYISFSDLCLAGHFDNDIEKAKRVIPGKAYIYEAMGKRMILGDNAANRERYPSQYKNVRFVQMGSPEELCKAILSEYE